MVKHDKNGIGLYRDNGLSVFKNENDFKLERIKKSLQKTFKDFGLETVAESNLRILTEKKNPKIKLQRLRKIRIWTFGSLVHQINSF